MLVHGVSRAEDPASLFIVRDPGYGTVGLTLSAQQETQTESVTFASPFFAFSNADHYRYQYQAATLGGSLGVGYGFELFLSVPNIIKHQTSRDGDDTNLMTGFGDAEFGLKYRLLGDLESPDRLILRATFTHHDSSLGTDEFALYYAHVFSPQFSVGLQSFYEYEAFADSFGEHYHPNQYGGSGLLFWNIAPNLSVIPLVRLYGTDPYDNVPSALTTQVGLQLGYYWSRSWSLTPTLTYLHTSGGHETVSPFYSINYGARDGGLASLLLQYQF
jgi:hypothetical protein